MVSIPPFPQRDPSPKGEGEREEWREEEGKGGKERVDSREGGRRRWGRNFSSERHSRRDSKKQKVLYWPVS